jgi:UDP-3-O-acyl N-acetylglucosamine deacetylase
VRVEFRPAAAHTGIVFVRSDMRPVRRIRATARNRVETPRRTTLTESGATVEMVEHILAALFGMQIDNCEVWADGLEMPAGDGSSQGVVEALRRAGPVEQRVLRKQIGIEQTIRVGSTDAWIEARPSLLPGLYIQYDLDYGNNTPIGQQSLQLEITPHTFCTHLAAARTFILEEEARRMRARGLGSRTTYQDVLVFDGQGPIENALRFADECVRHKVLDIVGDLGLAGCDLNAEIHGHRSGHRQNAQLIDAILAAQTLRQSWRQTA